MATQDEAFSESTVISDPTFRIITTLKHTLFNEHDLHGSESESDDIISQYRDLNSQLIRLHERRLRDAAQACLWPQVAQRLENSGPPLKEGEQRDLEQQNIDLEQALDEALRAQNVAPPALGHIRDLRVRILVDRAGSVAVEHAPMGESKPLSTLAASISLFPRSLPRPPSPPPSEPLCMVTLDTHPTALTLFTRHKTTHRTPYNLSRSRGTPALTPTTPPTQREVLLYDAAGNVTEASFSAVYFFRPRDGDGGWVTPRGGMASVTRTWAMEKGMCVEGLVAVEELRDGELVWLSNAVRGFFLGRVCIST